MSFPTEKTDEANQKLVQAIKAGDKNAFEKLFYGYYNDLCALAFKITQCTEQSRDVVQDVFLKIWKKRKGWEINTSLKAYLYQAIWNQALNRKNKKNSRRKLQGEFFKAGNHDVEMETIRPDDKTQPLVAEIWRIVDAMADRRKFVFILHRKHGLTYKEIAKVMGITRKTVENHMGLALKEIRNNINPDLLRA